jgi:hypothetical protein
VDGEGKITANKLLEPVGQRDRIVEMNGDMVRSLSMSEEQPKYFDGWLKWWIGR